MRVDVRTLKIAPAPAARHGKRIDLIETKTMSPAMLSGARTESFKGWAKKIKAYTNMRLQGYRQALELSKKLGKDKAADATVKASWQ